MVSIRGFEMPSDCMGCMFCNHIKNDDYGSHYGDCAILGDGKRMNLLLHQKHSYCPLVEIVTCKDCKSNKNSTCMMDGFGVADDYFCASAFCVNAGGECGECNLSEKPTGSESEDE